MACPDVAELEQFLLQVLDEPSSRSVELHLGSCPVCNSVLTELRENDRIESTVRAVYDCPEPAPERIGSYRILRVLGTGGTGVVYEAEQTEPRRRVALKVIGAPHVSDRRYDRLIRREARALARLKHPAIAAIYDAGQAADGRPFFVMELVEGSSITAHAAVQALSLDAKIALFQPVCEAIAFAHRRGVIHRDIKPGNILIEADRGPKVLDFGLAKVLDYDRDGSATATHSAVSEIGRIAGTLPYMSPEQVRGNPDDIDSRTDVYSLGVVLYELLTGRLPYVLNPGNLPDAARTICEQSPLPPSKACRAAAGDLETIVLKALAKEPDRRYATAGDLAADLGRYLRNEPVQARPASAWYQLRKFTARHRAVVTTAVVAVVALVAGAAVAVGQAIIATHERDSAVRRLAYAQQATNYVFAGVGNQIARVLGTGDSQRHLAEVAYKFYDRLAREDPDDIEARTWLWRSLLRLSKISLDVGDVERAHILALEARDLIEHGTADHPEAPRALSEARNAHVALAQVASVMNDAVGIREHLDAALALHERVVDCIERTTDMDDPAAWAVPLEGPNAGRTPAHIAVHRDWACIIASTVGPLLEADDPDAARQAYESAAETLARLRALDPTIDPIYREDVSEYAPRAARVLVRVGAAPHYDRANVSIHTALGRLALHRGNPDGAREHLQASLDLLHSITQQTPTEPATIALQGATHHHAAEVLLASGELAAAREHAKLAVEARRQLALSDPEHVVRQRELHDTVALLEALTVAP